MKENKQGKYILIYALFALALTFVTLKDCMVPKRLIISWWLRHPGIVFFNWLIIFIVLLAFHCFFTRIQYPMILTSFLVILLSKANKMKIIYRQEPVFFDDLYLVKEVQTILFEGNFSLKPILVGLAMIAVFGFIITRIDKGKYKLALKNRVLGLALIVVSSFALSQTVYAHDSIVDKFVPAREGSEEANIAQVFADQGIVYSFFKYRDVNSIQKPRAFRDMEVNKKIEAFEQKDLVTRPDVIYIMGEAWTDLSEEDFFQFKEGMDPFEILEPLYNEAISTGNIIVPSFGGGTSNTEFDALTGNSTLALSEGTFTAYSAVRRDTDSIASILKDQGYNTYALHPGHNWFYNRETVYRHFGFDRSEFLDDLHHPKMKGSFVSEAQTRAIFEDRISDLQENSDPYMALCVTIQNHSPFTEEKYGYVEDSFDTISPLPSEIKEPYEAYFTGIRDMNENLLKFTEFLDETDRPTVLVYWGDHLPSIYNGYSAYEAIDYDFDENTWSGHTNVYRTPYLVWGNKAFIEEYSREFKDYKYISSYYITPLMLDIIGGGHLDPFQDFSINLMKELPVVHRYFYMDESMVEQSIGTMSPEELDAYEIFKTWNYIRCK